MILRSLSLAAISLTLAACNISGSAQKGPFKEGSTLTSSQLDGSASPISSTTIDSEVFNNQGSFSVDSVNWSGWTELEVTGQYFNEFTGEDSAGALTLNAITNKNRRFDTANIHLFTHLAAARTRQLVADGQNISNAWRNTQTEMSDVFGLSRVRRNVNRGVEQLSLIQGRGQYRQDNANLLLFTGSFLAAGGNATSLQALSDDFADDAQFNGVGETAFNAIAIAGNGEDLLETLSQNLSANGAENPPNSGDQSQLPIWVNTDDVVGEVDVTAPVITVNGDSSVQLEVGTVYDDANFGGASATDETDGNVAVDVNNNVVAGQLGIFTVTYSATDLAGNTATETREVIIVDTTPPVITLLGANPQTIEAVSGGSDLPYQDPGSTVADNFDTGLIASVDSSNVNLTQAGDYTVTYTVNDSSGVPAVAVTRDVTVIPGAYQIILLAQDPDATADFFAPRGIDQAVFIQGVQFITAIVDANGSPIEGDVVFTPLTVAELATPGTYSLLLSYVDNLDRTVTRTLSVEVTNATPVANAQSVVFEEDTSDNVIILSASDSDLIGLDPDFSTLSYSIVSESGPTNGSLGGTAPNVTYTPNPDFFGEDTFEFSVSDGIASSTATVTINVTDVPEPEYRIVFVIGELTSEAPLSIYIPRNEDTTNTASAIETVATIVRFDGTTVEGVEPSFDLSSIDFSVIGESELVLSFTDEYERLVTNIINVNVTNVAPVALSQEVGFDEDTNNNDIILEGTDADRNDSLTYTVSIDQQPNNGILSGVAPNVSYTPNPDFAGQDSFTFTVSDGLEESIGTVIINVIDIPEAVSTSDVTGRIIEADGSVVEGVIVSVYADGELLGKANVESDANGNFSKTLTADTEFTLQFNKEGYATQVIPVKSPVAGTSVAIDVMLIERGVVQTFILEKGGAELSGEDGASVYLSSGAFVDSDGNAISDEIEVTITPVDISTSAGVQAFPGAFAGIAEGDDEASSIVSYGTVEYRFTLKSTGEELQLAEDQEAEITIPMYDSRRQDGSLYEIGDPIALWYLNEVTGIWEQEGFGEVVSNEVSPTGLALLAIVTHFSWWNCDVTNSPGNVDIEVKGPVGSGSAVIHATTNGNVGGWRPSAVNTIVAIGGTVQDLPIPSNGRTCLWVEYYFTSGDFISTPKQCRSPTPGENLPLMVFETTVDLPFLIGVNPDVSDAVVEVTLEDPIDIIRFSPFTQETTVTYVITKGELPNGLNLESIDQTTANIIGTPLESGLFSIIVLATDDEGNSQSFNISFNVREESISLSWLERFGNERFDKFQNVASDGQGNIYAVGETGSLSPSSTQPYGNSSITKYNLDGDVIWTSVFITSKESFNAAVVDGNGDIYVVGATGPQYRDETNALLAKYDDTGILLWSTIISGEGTDYFYDVAIDQQGNVYAAGASESTLGDITDGNTGNRDTLIVKFDSGGNKLWDKTLGSTSFDQFYSIAIDNNDNIYAAGIAQAIDGDFSGPLIGSTDAILVKFDTSGNVFWERNYGSSNRDSFRDISVDGNGNLFIAGNISNIATVLKIDGDGDVIWQESYNPQVVVVPEGQYSEPNSYNVNSITLDNAGDIYLVGDVRFPCFEVDCYADRNAFIAKFKGGNGELINARDIGGSNEEYLYGVTNTSDGEVVAVGYTTSKDGDFLFESNRGGESIIMKTGTGYTLGSDVVEPDPIDIIIDPGSDLGPVPVR